MSIIDVELLDESQTRYLTYALSVVGSRALPDVRDGLKPVQRRILYAMSTNLNLSPDKAHRKSAAVVGEVLARFHPHGDSACYEAMVRMAQDFSLRYPLVDGQGNFGSLDGDGAAAYRYTEARLTQIALEVVGDIAEKTVVERLNFDQTTSEPVVLPSRVPNVLINGASGIAVGMATAIPPHNLREATRALQMLIADDKVTESQLLGAIKGPDFPTGCLILNTKAELKQIYKTGRGAVKMRGDYEIEKGARGKNKIVITSIPYGVDKSVLVEKIADLIIARKVPQLDDVRDESTDEVRVVLEMTSGANAEKAMWYLYKNTPLESNFNVNLTALIPTDNPLTSVPKLLSLREVLNHFLDFRMQVTKAKLLFEREKLAERIHLLEGLIKVIDVLDEVIKIVRKSEGRSDAAKKIQKKFNLSEAQAYFIVDLRVYQLSKTNVDEVDAELKEKKARVKQIDKILKSTKELKRVISTDLQRISDEYGDERRSKVVTDVEEEGFSEEDYIAHEDVYVIVTKDGWLKRIRQANDPQGTRIREGDAIAFVAAASTKDSIALFSSLGNLYVLKANDISSTSGFGEPVQKKCRFKDGEQIVACLHLPQDQENDGELLVYSSGGYGSRISEEMLGETKKTGKRIAKLGKGDVLAGVVRVEHDNVFALSRDGYGLLFDIEEVPLLSSAGKGVILQKMSKGDKLVALKTVKSNQTVDALVKKGGARNISISEIEESARARRGRKVVHRGLPVLGWALDSKS